MAEVQTGDSPVTAGKWKLRLIGSHLPLPILIRDATNNVYSVKEVKDYYVPNDKHVIFRYSVKTTAALIATVQVQTSKSDVIIKLQILDSEEEIVNTIGKGHAVIPAFNFISNERPLSSQSSKGQVGQGSVKKEPEVASSPKKKGTVSGQKNIKTVTKPLQEGPASVEEEAFTFVPVIEENIPQQPHKYIIQAQVLHNSWPLTESQMTFVQSLRELEKNEIKAHAVEKHEESISTQNPDVHSNTEGQKSAGSSKATRKTKEKATDKAEKTAKEKPPSASSRPESQSDPNKPTWILRFVIEQNEADALDVKKDTERADEIKAMKQAWEAAEPGRAVKAYQERIRFINKCMRKGLVYPEVEPASTGETEVVSPGAEPMTSPTATETGSGAQRKEWEFLDLTPYLRKTLPEPVLKNESIIQQQEMQKAEEISLFRQFREMVLEHRQQEHMARHQLKQNVIEMYEEQQATLDEARGRVLTIREAYRNKLLEAERLKQEAQAAEEAALRAEQEKKTPDVQKKKPGKQAGKKK